MTVLQGKVANEGYAIGKLYYYKKKNTSMLIQHVQDIETEIKRFHKARKKTIQQLMHIYEKSCLSIGKENAQIFEIHAMMLDDEDFYSGIEETISIKKINAEGAVMHIAQEFSKMLEDTEDAYIAARSADVKDISTRLISVLTNSEQDSLLIPESVILAADDLMPSETIRIDTSKILALITEKGSVNSHTAIIARGLGIPAIVHIGEKQLERFNGKQIIVDGFIGTVYIDADAKTIQKYSDKKQQLFQEQQDLKNLLEAGTQTLDGKVIKLYANIGNEKEVTLALTQGAEGIGLLRSEFLYLERDSLPTEEELFQAYSKIAQKLDKKKLIIRTVDLGSDKNAPYLNLPLEENPALGMRGIRICIQQPELFITQLRAILRASIYKNISLMFPMISSIEEIHIAKKFLKQAQKSLDKEHIDYNHALECGIMIETPAAAILSDMLAKEVDFFSIGSNDLSQYTLALDRQNPDLDYLYESHTEAILRLIDLTCKNALQAGIWVGICGELGANIELTEKLLRMGINEFSVSSSKILKVRKKIRESSIQGGRL